MGKRLRVGIIAALTLFTLVAGVGAVWGGIERSAAPEAERTLEFAAPPVPTPVFVAEAAAAPLVDSTPSATAGAPSPSAPPLPEKTPAITPKATPCKPPELEAATPKPTPSEEKEPVREGKPLGGLVIGLDPGHQKKSNNELEPVAPGSSDVKKKVSSGTQGRYTGTPEHEVNLSVGLLLRDLLREAGATVVMTRTKADVNISNAERATLFNEKKVDLGVRLHCNGSTNAEKQGAFMLVPGNKDYPFYSENIKAAKEILAAYGKETGLSTKRGITYPTDQTGFNWCTRPIVNIEMGHMTYEADDRKLVDPDFQKKMAKGIFNGIVAYFGNAN